MIAHCGLMSHSSIGLCDGNETTRGEMWYVGRRSEETSDIDVASQSAHLLTLGEGGDRWRSRSEQSAFYCGPGWTRCAVAEICESAQAGLTVPGYVLAGPGCPQSAVHGADASAE